MSEPRPQKKSRLHSRITMRATMQINTFTRCLKLAMLQGMRLGNFLPPVLLGQSLKPLAKWVPTHSKGNAFCCSSGEEMWGMNYQLQDKIMFGQHPAQNGNASGISKLRDMDPGQQKTLDEITALGKQHLLKLQLLWLSAGVTCCWSAATVLKTAKPSCHSRSLGKNNAVTLLSQAQVQHSYKYLLLMAVTYKAALWLRTKQYRNSACWSMAAGDLSRARGWEERKGIWGRKQWSSTRDVKHKGFQGKAEVSFRDVQQRRKNE